VIAQNAVFGHLRQRPRNEYLFLDPSNPTHENKPSIFGQSYEQTDSAEEIALQRDHTGLLKVLGELHPHHAEILILKHIVGMSFREAAEHIGIPSNTARTRAFYGIQKLLKSADINPAGARQGEDLRVIASLLMGVVETTAENDKTPPHS
jgi:DNA-directed RNA polymerase specialized sigma24 family protein